MKPETEIKFKKGVYILGFIGIIIVGVLYVPLYIRLLISPKCFMVGVFAVGFTVVGIGISFLIWAMKYCKKELMK